MYNIFLYNYFLILYFYIYFLIIFEKLECQGIVSNAAKPRLHNRTATELRLFIVNYTYNVLFFALKVSVYRKLLTIHAIFCI